MSSAEDSEPKWKWKCRNCGRGNATVPDDNGKVKCEFCTDVMSIRPSRLALGGKSKSTAAQIARDRGLPVTPAVAVVPRGRSSSGSSVNRKA